jgi:hypothetical protein
VIVRLIDNHHPINGLAGARLPIIPRDVFPNDQEDSLNTIEICCREEFICNNNSLDRIVHEHV